MRISDLTQEERKAFEEHLLSTYRYDAATGKKITDMSSSMSSSKENGLCYGNIGWCSSSYTAAFQRRLTMSTASRPTTALKIYAR